MDLHLKLLFSLQQWGINNFLFALTHHHKAQCNTENLAAVFSQDGLQHTRVWRSDCHAASSSHDANADASNNMTAQKQSGGKMSAITLKHVELFLLIVRKCQHLRAPCRFRETKRKNPNSENIDNMTRVLQTHTLNAAQTIWFVSL